MIFVLALALLTGCGGDGEAGSKKPVLLDATARATARWSPDRR
jgi:hypothetical protein